MRLTRLILLMLLLANFVTAHTKREASDGCHREGDTYHCHSADTSIGFVSNEAGYYTISSVTDGDTLDVVYGLGTLRVRLFGVDTPETKKGAKLTADAKAILKAQGILKSNEQYDDLLAAEKQRQLTLGNAAKQHVIDTLADKDVFFLFENTTIFPFIQQGKYGRYLAYIFYAEDGNTHFLNIDLIAENIADRDYIESPFRYRWAFISDDLGEIVEMFSNQSLPAADVSNAPLLQRGGITTTWAALKLTEK